jgi:hypothetical protein
MPWSVRTRLHRLLAPLVAIALAGGMLASASIAGAADVGINVTASQGNWFTSPKVRAAIRATHPSWVRVFVGWNALEPQQGTYDVADIQNYQRFFAKLPAGTKIDVDVEGSPAWANGGSADVRTPPTDPNDYAAFVNYLANAFHGRVNAWEIWNEEDNSGWWNGTPAQYASLLKTAYPAIKSADPRSSVIIGGLTGNDGPYLSQLYADGAHGSFDAVGVHTDTACNIASPYTFEYNQGTHTVNQYFFLGFTAIRDVMVAAGDSAKPIYMTELGWSSTTAECQTGHWAGQKAAGVAPQTQATYLEQAYHCLAQPAYSYVKAAMWFGLFDNGQSTTPLDNFGLLNAAMSPKPAFAAFQDESLHGDQLSGPCGNFAPPAIRILHPTPSSTYSGALHIVVSATSPANGVREITIQLKRGVRIHFLAKGFPAKFKGTFTWLGAKTIKPGVHTIKVTVTDKLGNVSTVKITVIHVVTLGKHGGGKPHH